MKYAIVKFLDEKSVKLSVLLNRFTQHAAAKWNRQTMRCSIKPSLKTFALWCGDPETSEITVERVNDFIASMNGFKSNTIRHKLIVLYGVFKFGVAEGLCSENPFEKVTIPRAMFAGRTVPDGILRKFLSLLPTRVRDAAEFSLWTGMRRGEILAMDWRWVHGRFVTIPAEIAKSRKPRKIYLTSGAMDAMGRPCSSGRVFRITPYRITYSVARAWKKIGIGRIRFHDMRHISATKYYDRTRDLHAMMETFGWASPSSTMPYQHVGIERHVKNMRMLSYRI